MAVSYTGNPFYRGTTYLGESINSGLDALMRPSRAPQAAASYSAAALNDARREKVLRETEKLVSEANATGRLGDLMSRFDRTNPHATNYLIGTLLETGRDPAQLDPIMRAAMMGGTEDDLRRVNVAFGGGYDPGKVVFGPEGGTALLDRRHSEAAALQAQAEQAALAKTVMGNLSETMALDPGQSVANAFGLGPTAPGGGGGVGGVRGALGLGGGGSGKEWQLTDAVRNEFDRAMGSLDPSVWANTSDEEKQLIFGLMGELYQKGDSQFSGNPAAVAAALRPLLEAVDAGNWLQFGDADRMYRVPDDLRGIFAGQPGSPTQSPAGPPAAPNPAARYRAAPGTTNQQPQEGVNQGAGTAATGSTAGAPVPGADPASAPAVTDTEWNFVDLLPGQGFKRGAERAGPAIRQGVEELARIAWEEGAVPLSEAYRSVNPLVDPAVERVAPMVERAVGSTVDYLGDVVTGVEAMQREGDRELIFPDPYSNVTDPVEDAATATPSVDGQAPPTPREAVARQAERAASAAQGVVDRLNQLPALVSGAGNAIADAGNALIQGQHTIRPIPEAPELGTVAARSPEVDFEQVLSAWPMARTPQAQAALVQTLIDKGYSQEEIVSGLASVLPPTR